jgi:hypothetical protein
VEDRYQRVFGEEIFQGQVGGPAAVVALHGDEAGFGACASLIILMPRRYTADITIISGTFYEGGWLGPLQRQKYAP